MMQLKYAGRPLKIIFVIIHPFIDKENKETHSNVSFSPKYSDYNMYDAENQLEPADVWLVQFNFSFQL